MVRIRVVARSVLRSLPLVVAAAALTAGAVIGFGPAGSPIPRAANPATLTAASPEPPRVVGAWEPVEVSTAPLSWPVADAIGPQVRLYEQPDVAHPRVPVLDNPTWERLAVVFAVLEERGPWLRVRVSARPNGFEAWVEKAEVSQREVPNHVVIEVGARRVTVLRGDEVLLRETAAMGSDATPTPLGSFFVDGVVDVPYDDGPYGAFQVSVSGFSDVLHTFGGGVGQIAVHGTDRPDLLGQPVSNGCIRLSNDAITRMAALTPTGTPVEIVA